MAEHPQEQAARLKTFDTNLKPLDHAYVTLLREMFAANPFPAIHVMGYYVLDGQHRLEAAKDRRDKWIRVIKHDWLNVARRYCEQIRLDRCDSNARKASPMEYRAALRRSIRWGYTLEQLTRMAAVNSMWVFEHLGLRLFGYKMAMESGTLELQNAVLLSQLPREKQKDFISMAQTLRSIVFEAKVSKHRIKNCINCGKRLDVRLGHQCPSCYFEEANFFDSSLGIPYVAGTMTGRGFADTYRLINAITEETLATGFKKLADKLMPHQLDAYEMLHGKRPIDSREVGLPCKTIDQTPKGWDKVMIDNQAAYCCGVLLVTRLGNEWRITETGVKDMAIHRPFITPTEAATWAEEYLK